MSPKNFGCDGFNVIGISYRRALGLIQNVLKASKVGSHTQEERLTH
jgi:hypothetical protein